MEEGNNERHDQPDDRRDKRESASKHRFAQTTLNTKSNLVPQPPRWRSCSPPRDEHVASVRTQDNIDSDPIQKQVAPNSDSDQHAFTAIHCKDLSRDVAWRDLTHKFSKCRCVIGLYVAVNNRGRAQGYGSVEFWCAEPAETALADLKGSDLCGHPLVLERAKPRRGNTSVETTEICQNTQPDVPDALIEATNTARLQDNRIHNANTEAQEENRDTEQIQKSTKKVLNDTSSYDSVDNKKRTRRSSEYRLYFEDQHKKHRGNSEHHVSQSSSLNDQEREAVRSGCRGGKNKGTKHRLGYQRGGNTNFSSVDLRYDDALYPFTSRIT